MPTQTYKKAEARRAQLEKERNERADAQGKKRYLAAAHPKNAPTKGRGTKVKARAENKGRNTKEAVRRHVKQVAKAKKNTAKTTCGDNGGRTATGARCSYAAGRGTTHEGIGRCFRHGGRKDEPKRGSREKQIARATRGQKRPLPSDRGHEVVDKSAPKTLTDARALLGIPIEMNPMDALLWCIRITAGEIKWYSDRMQELEEHEWIEETFVGKQLHMYARNRSVSVDRLAKYSKWAVDSGIAERAMRLAEAYGEQLYQLLSGIFDDLNLSPTQRREAPAIVAKHMLSLEKRNILHSPNELTRGRDPETIVVGEDGSIQVTN